MGKSEEWLALTAFCTGRASLIELKDDIDVSLWPSQPSVTGNWPSSLAPSCGESSGRLVMTSHYELRAVLSAWPIPNTIAAYLATAWTEGKETHQWS